MTGRLIGCCSALVLVGCGVRLPSLRTEAAIPANAARVTLHVKDMCLLLNIG
jgi:hypothetical protein